MQVILSFKPVSNFVSHCQLVKPARKLNGVKRKRPHERIVNNKNNCQRKRPHEQLVNNKNSRQHVLTTLMKFSALLTIME